METLNISGTETDITMLAVIATASEYSQYLFPDNQMDWRGKRTNFVNGFIEEFKQKKEEFKKLSTDSIIQQVKKEVGILEEGEDLE